MAKDFSTMEDSNRSANADIHQSSDPGKRTLLQGGLSASLSALFGGSILAGCAISKTGAVSNPIISPIISPMANPKAAVPKIGFKGIPVSTADTMVVPDGYVARAMVAWGEPVGIAGHMPAFKDDASNTSQEQEAQMGMHHDGVHFFPLDASRRGLLTMNHEYVDDGLLHVGGLANWSAEKVRKAQAAHGISVVELEHVNGQWNVVRPSRYARRLTAYTPFAVQGPAAGHPLMQTAADPAGRTVLGTLNNCASGMTPWGTYLSGEENWAFYFDAGDAPSAHQKRWGARKAGFYGWPKFDERFNLEKHPNEFNRFGWVVEVDPYDPSSIPVKRTAVGRAAHEGAWIAVTEDQHAVVYSGEDARFEYIYKFVSRDKIAAGGGKANRELLDHGTLYVARFGNDGKGQWLPLIHGRGPLTAQNGFADQGEVVIKARQASDLLGGTKMDRPEWLTIDPLNKQVYCTLTNNSERGKPGQPGVDAANPRAVNVMGQIIRWKEQVDFDGLNFDWDHLVMAGDPANTRAEAKGNIKGDIFACPDGLAFDARGVLWIQTDAHASQMYKGELERIGSNQMLACDVATGEVRRFFTGPVNCEVTGLTFTPDMRTAFINIQHPGENASDRSDPSNPTAFSTWPDGPGAKRPRSATVVIQKKDGGIIGT
jgi:uncharacterized protein